MNEQTMRFRVGVFVLAMLALLAVLITLFGGFPTLFQRHSEYTVVFPDAPGVATGTPVRRSGVAIGEVKSVNLDDETGQVRVRVVLEKQHTLRKGDQAVLVRGLLGGDVSIDFIAPKPGQPGDGTPIEPGAEFKGTKQTDVQALLNQTSEVMPGTQEALKDFRDLAKLTRELLPELRRTNDEMQVAARSWGKVGERLDVLLQTNEDKLVKTIDNLNDTLKRVGTVFNDENQRNLTATLRNVRTGSENLDSISRNTDALLKESRVTIQRVNDSVKQADEVLANLQRATKPMAERGDSVMRNLDESTQKFNRSLDDLREFLRLLNRQEGTLRQLMADPALYNNLTDASIMLTRILPRLDRIMRDLEVFADKIARHPESLGVGGAIRPSSGLK